MLSGVASTMYHNLSIYFILVESRSSPRNMVTTVTKSGGFWTGITAAVL